jgi:hypothetical protein
MQANIHPSPSIFTTSIVNNPTQHITNAYHNVTNALPNTPSLPLFHGKKAITMKQQCPLCLVPCTAPKITESSN